MSQRKGVALVLVFMLLGAAALVARHMLRPSGEVLRVGAITIDPPATNSALGQAVRQGFALARNDLEKEWGGALCVELVFVDSGDSPTTGAERVADLHKQGVNLLADIVGDEVISGCAAAVRQNKVVLVSATSANPALTGAFGPYLFRVAPQEGAAARELARWAHESRAEHPVVVFSDDARGKSFKAAFVQAWGGLADTLTLRVSPGLASSQKVVERVKEKAPDAIFLFTSSPDAAEIVKDLKGVESNVRVFGTDAFADPLVSKAVGQACLAQVGFVVCEAATSPSSRRTALAASWRQEFGGASNAEPPEAVFLAYDALQALARAARASGGDVEKTLAQLHMIDLDGATGRVAFDENGDRRTPPLTRKVFTDQGVPFVSTGALGTSLPTAK